MLDLNNYVATSVSWPKLYYVKPGLKPAKNAKKMCFPNRNWTRKQSNVKSFADVAWLRSRVEPQKEREI